MLNPLQHIQTEHAFHESFYITLLKRQANSLGSLLEEQLLEGILKGILRASQSSMNLLCNKATNNSFSLFLKISLVLLDILCLNLAKKVCGKGIPQVC